MANSNIGNFSKRRTEALKFLSYISLDGNYCGPVKNFHRKDIQSERTNGVNKKFNNLIYSEVITEEISDSECDSQNCHGTHAFTSRKCVIDDRHSISSDTDNISLSKMQIAIEPIVTKSILSHSSRSKKRIRASNSESGTGSKIMLRKKKVQHTATCSDSEYHYGSSCENIDPVISHLKAKAAACRVITKQNGNASIRFVNSVRDHVFHGERIIMLTKRRFPFLVCSFIPYEKNEKNRPDFHKEVFKKRHTTRPRPTSMSGDFCNRFDLFGVPRSEDVQEVSYEKLLVPSHAFKEYLNKKHISEGSADCLEHIPGKNRHLLSRCYSYDQATQKSTVLLSTSPPILNTKDNIYMPSTILYNPALLDDPELMAGKHRTLLTFSSYVTSIIDYVRPCDLKKEINDKFKEKFPYIKLTLSKLRSIKKDMCKAARTESGAEFLTVAQAYVYFEKLILLGLINKQNRKLSAAASLLLSAKLNDYKGDTLRVLIEKIENIFRLNRKELLESEFAVLVALEFGLHVPASEIIPHYQRLLYAF